MIAVAANRLRVHSGVGPQLGDVGESRRVRNVRNQQSGDSWADAFHVLQPLRPNRILLKFAGDDPLVLLLCLDFKLLCLGERVLDSLADNDAFAGKSLDAEV